MIGHPKYTYGQKVRFKSGHMTREGTIEIIDAWGTFYQSEEVSYDIMVTEQNCLYKHIRESKVNPIE